MYEAYWRLASRPFDEHTNPSAYFPGQSYQGALLKIRYAVESRHFAALVTGSWGVGKTLICRVLASQVASEFAPFVHIVFPQMPAPELLCYVADEIGAPAVYESNLTVKTQLGRIRQAISENVQRGRHTVVVLDEAQLILDSESLEAVRLLLNFDYGPKSGCGMTLILCGQAQLLPILERLPQWEERLTAKCVLRPFLKDETAQYVQHRIRAAGGSEQIFEANALEAIHRTSQGVPRRINRICDMALLLAYADERRTVSQDQIESVANELQSVAPE